MLRVFHRTKNRPKRIEAITQAVYNGAPMPDEMVRFSYRKLFKLTSYEFEAEPVDEFFINLLIYAEMQKKEKVEAKHGSS